MNPAIAKLRLRAEAQRALADAPDDMLIDTQTLALLLDSTEGSIRQRICEGVLGVDVVKVGRSTRYRLGDVRQKIRSRRVAA